MKKIITLNNGQKMPTVGLGTWRSEKNKVGESVKHALLKCEYHHVDCASIYGNEKEMGSVFGSILSKNEIKRKDVFVTSKLWNTDHNPKNVEKACKKSLANLKLKYLDLYLIHWGIAFKPGKNLEPVGKNGIIKTESIAIQSTWKAMEDLVKKGLVKSIGVANFTAPMLIDLLSYAKIRPAINQIEIHPYNSQYELVEFCKKQAIEITAYSPLGSLGNAGKKEKKLLNNEVIKAIAVIHKKTPAQILIRWSLQRGLIVIPKSTRPNRIAENIQIFDFLLSDKQMKSIDNLNKDCRSVDPSNLWGVPYFK